jgi:hypothetical protein
MKRSVVLLLLLAACASHEPPAVRACDAQANDDPDVRHLLAASAGSDTFALQHHYELEDARKTAKLRCLRARGIAAQGGVEAPARSHNFFDDLF